MWLHVTTKINFNAMYILARTTLFKAACSTLLHLTVYLPGTDCSLYGNLREGVLHTRISVNV